jgi:hypothetical protein
VMIRLCSFEAHAAESNPYLAIDKMGSRVHLGSVKFMTPVG